MEKIRIKVSYKDQEYNKALEKALILRSNTLVLSNDKPDVLLDETSCPPFQPVQSIISKIMANMNRPNGPAKPLKNVKFTAFTAAIGGGGLSTTAHFYARIASRIFGRKVAFVSFDPWYRNNFPKEDEFGIVYLESIPKMIDADELVLDVPYGVENYRDKLDICEKRVVVLGFNDNRSDAGEKLFKDLEDSAATYIDPPFTIKFKNDLQDYLDINDIHSELGKEVLELARKLEEE